MPRVAVLIVALFFLAGGIAHFMGTDLFVNAMPDYLSHQEELVIVSGIFELLGAVGILIPKTRVFAAYGLIVLVVVVFPVNINMALHPNRYAGIPVILLYIRLPLQLLFIWFIWWAVTPERLKNKSTASSI